MYRPLRPAEVIVVPHGIVKWFDHERGAGLVAQSGGGPDVLAYRSAIQGAEGARTLLSGESVSFNLVEDFEGIRAENIYRLRPQDRSPS
ncbi:Cold shock protein ScoF [Streptomyces rimosus subsp. rimosus]|nr:Cold shock protein ScoF [Streptomyces rimosus subsp. rimosus]UTI00052.1 Cold shock protein ScoF [Streptomyces rimosus subsp. rimosus]